MIKLNFMTQKLYNRLSNIDKEMIKSFIENNLHLSKNDFEFKLNRLYLDKNDKPKDYLSILEILSNHNSAR